MLYILRDTANNILSYSTTPFTLGEGQTQEELENNILEYANRFRLRSNKRIIRADGVDYAIVLVETTVQVSYLDLSVNNTIVSVPLENGIGSIELDADTAGDISITPADRTQYCVAGEGSVYIQAIA